MDLTPEQQAKAKVLFEYEEAKKAIAQCRDDIQLWGKTLIAIGEAILNHPATIVFNGQQSSGESLVALREPLSGLDGQPRPDGDAGSTRLDHSHMNSAQGEQIPANGSPEHHSEEVPARPTQGSPLRYDCGGSAASGGSGANGTPAGTYTLNVKGTLTSGATTTTAHNINLTLTVN